VQGALTPEIVKSTLNLRNAQIERFLVNTREASSIDDVTIVLGRVSSNEIAAFILKLKNIVGVTDVNVVSRDVGPETK
jgi:hypothetical protein